MMRNSRRKAAVAASTVAACLLLAAPAPADVLLQWFEASWETMERRMPDVFNAGYDGIWVPPPGIADSGGFSVGYDVFDRFDFGGPFNRTLYGTTDGFSRMSDEMDQADIPLYIDAVLNHNGFRDASTPGFVDAGDYPGFVTTLPFDVDGDFHSSFEGGVLTGRLAGLIDIAQEKNYQFVRHPVPGFSNLIPNETPLEENRRFYPDQDLPEEFGRHPFNLADPMAGDPTEENSTGLLLRYMQWMVEVHGVDGFRLDAVRHMPTFFFNDFYDAALFNVGRNPRDGSPFTPFSFGEAFTGDFGELSAYTRKDGFGNRDVLDFPLKFAMKSVFDAGGFGDMRNIENASFDGSDGDPNDGSRGVMFVNSHDEFGGGFFNGYNNIPHAHIITRTGLPVVYYNAKQFGDGRDFPKDGRGDALGNFGDTLIDLVHVNDTHIRGPHATRWIDEDIYIYERQNAAVIGLSDRGDSGFDERNVQTAFEPGTVLVELTGNATNPAVDPGDTDIFNSVTVDGSGRVSIRVPRNSAGGNFHGRGYVVYGPEVPDMELTIANQNGELGPDPDDGRPEAVRRLSTLPIVTADTIEVELDRNGGGVDDNALIKLNYGLELDGDGLVSPTGDFAGFEEFDASSPSFGGGTGDYSISIDATGLEEGYQYIETVAFLQRNGGPALYDVDRTVVYLDRVPPQTELLFPTQTGTEDIQSESYEFVVRSDRTADSVHMIWNPPASEQDVLAMVSPDNQARRHDRLEWRQVIDGITDGTHEVAVVAFEETGNSSVTRFDNINAVLTFPEIEVGVDINTSPGASGFVPLPGEITTAAYPPDIVVRVNTQTTPGGPIDFSAGDYTVSLQVDDDTPLVAQPFDSGLLPPVGRLVQNDQDLGDQWDEFRFVWRGYSRGQHRFTATAELTDMSRPPAEAVATVNVAESTPGPTVTLTNPPATGVVLNNPDTLSIEGTFGTGIAEAQIFVDREGSSRLLRSVTSPAEGPFTFVEDLASFAVDDVIPTGALETMNGDYTVRVVASTGANGSGISSEAAGEFTVEGQFVPDDLPEIIADGNAAEIFEFPAIAASAADGPGDGAVADFGADGTLTELRAGIRGTTLGLGLRGEMFGDTEENTGNASFIFIDVDPGAGTGVTDVAGQLTDVSDGLRSDISNAAFLLDVANRGFDAVVAITEPNIAFGYSFGTGGLAGGFGDFAFQPGIVASYDSDTAAFDAAPGTTISGSDTMEVRIPLSVLGNPDPTQMEFAAATASDMGFPSPNTLPENASNAFDNTQTIEALASIPVPSSVVINEIATGMEDVIELYNPGAQTVDLTGWALRFEDSAGVKRDYRFPAGTMITGDGYLLVSDAGGAGSKGSVATTLLAGFNIPWDDSRGGAVGLVSEHGVGVDYVAWRDVDNTMQSDFTRAIPAGTEFSGTVRGADAPLHTLARDENSTDSDSAADWDPESGADAPGPTLGRRNDANVPPSDLWWLR